MFYKAVAHYENERVAKMSRSPKRAMMMATSRGKPDRIVLFKDGRVISGGQEGQGKSKLIIRKGENYVEDQTDKKKWTYYS